MDTDELEYSTDLSSGFSCDESVSDKRDTKNCLFQTQTVEYSISLSDLSSNPSDCSDCASSDDFMPEILKPFDFEFAPPDQIWKQLTLAMRKRGKNLDSRFEKDKVVLRWEMQSYGYRN